MCTRGMCSQELLVYTCCHYKIDQERTFVRCLEVVTFLESLLLEVSLLKFDYDYVHD